LAFAIMDLKLLDDPSLPYLRRLGLDAKLFPGYSNQQEVFHRLDITLVSFIIQGECCHAIGAERFAETGPCLGITPRGGIHCLLTGQEGIEVMNLYLDLGRLALPRFPGQLNEALQLLFPLSPKLNNQLNRVLRVGLPPGSAAVGNAFNVLRELQGGACGHEEAALGYFQLFLLDVCRSVLDTGVSTCQAPNLQLARVVERLDKHYQEPLTLAGLAELAGLSPTSLCRAFKRHTGRSVFAYLLERRLQAAMFHLRSSDDKIIKVAFDCGFNDLSFFNRAFKRLTSMSPGQWRGGG